MNIGSPARAEGRLAIRQSLVAALIGLMLGIAFSAVQISRDYQDSEAGERRQVDQMLGVMREPAAQASYHLNTEAAAVVVQGVLSVSPVYEVELRNDFGETLARGRNDQLKVDPAAWWTRFVAPTQAYRQALVFGPARQPVGELRVVAARGPRIERFLQDVGRDVAVSVLKSLLVALALGIWFYATLTRPLMAVARRIGQGPSSAETAPSTAPGRADEIGEIAAAFDRYEHEAHERERSLESSAAALAASELRHRRIVETAGEGVWQFDDQGRTTLANEAMARMLGTTMRALVGRAVFDFVHDDDRAAVEHLLALRGSDNERRELRFLRPDGSDLWAEVSTCPMTDADGRHAGMLAMVTDATERRRRDEELRASNAQLRSMVGDLERHKQDMTHIVELNELMQSARNEPEAFHVIREIGTTLFGQTPGALSITGDGDDMVRVAAWGSTARVPLRYDRASCWSIRRGGPHLHAPGLGVCCAHDLEPDGSALLCVPLYVEGQLLGVLHVADAPELRDSALRQRVELFGEAIKLGLSNLRLRETLRDQALRDPLTGLPNRRVFDDTLPRELARCSRSGVPLTVAVIDVDRFKHFNDTYGHDVGDRVLQSVADTLLRNIRAGDLACRYGGDEFLCLLVGTSTEEALSRFGALQAQTPALHGPVADGLPEAVTFTIGLAGAPESGTDALELMRAADAALYAAKARGGHCVEAACPLVDEPDAAMPVQSRASVG